ncbi:BRO family protein [Phytobacter palmae]|uniref:BRO family protein n=1 Tax=Phytobacter palmae TaxID=1855371 RepID=A0ABU9V8C7_9ENTR
MNIVAKTGLNFQGIHLQPIANLADTWLTASQIGFALQYADDKAVQRIYSRHADEFTENMTRVVKVTTPYGEQLTRAFSLRGAHLVAMFARTPKAKDFRRWVLDILDREAAQSPITKQFTDQELSDLAWLWRASDVMIAACESVYGRLSPLKHRPALRT